MSQIYQREMYAIAVPQIHADILAKFGRDMNQQDGLWAITLHQPWAYAFTSLGKDIENRTWRCRFKPGTWVAIHAGKRFDQAAADWIKRVIGKLVGSDGAERQAGIVAIARFKGNVTNSESGWFVGPVGWQFDRVVPVERIDIKGRQGWWRVPDDVAQKLIAIAAQAEADSNG